MSHSRLFFYILLGFLSGIALHSFFNFYSIWIWISVACLILGGVIIFWRTPYFVASILIGMACLIGLWRFELGLGKLHATFVSGETVFKAAGEIRRYPKSYQFVGQNDRGRFWVIMSFGIPPEVGDTVSGDCRYEQVKETDQYYGWYAAKGTSSVCFLKNQEVIESGNHLLKKLFGVKQAGLDHVNRLFNQSSGALLGGMLFGGTSGLSKEAAENFRTAGLTHLVAISGYNFSLLAFFIVSIFEFLYVPRRIVSVVTIALLIIFFILVGPSASAARAVLMSGMILVAKIFGRQRNISHIFTVVAAGLLLVNPLSLRYDAGFVLSFVATGTLIYAVPLVLENLIKWMSLKKIKLHILWWPLKDIIKTFFEIIAASSLIMITTAPVLWWFFGRVSLASVVSNTLVGPIVPLVMVEGYLFAIISFISLPVSGIFVWSLDLLLKYIIGVAQFLS